MSTNYPTRPTQSKPAGLPPQRLREVRDKLVQASAFKQMPLGQQQALTDNLTHVVNYLEDPHAGLGSEVAGVARALDQPKPDPATQLRERVAGGQKLVGEDFRAGGAREGADVIADTVNKVDFVKFVAGLIDGVFNSIVNSSIKQMNAFASFLENVVKSVGEFANDHVTQNQARDALVGKFPNALKLDGLDQGQPKLAVRDDIDDKDKPDFKQALGVDADVEDAEGEQVVVQAMRLQMARQRQQLLSQILLMGLNRIIVTEGEIKAAVLFDVRTTDAANRDNSASMYDRNSHVDSHRDSSFWGTESSATVNTQVSTANADEHQASSANVEMHTKLSGSVLVKFKSDVFPLEKFASGDEMSALQTKSSK
jgi:hypothetical protein